MKQLNTVEGIRNFIKDNKLSLIYFSSNDCGVCSVLLPKVEEMLKDYPKIMCAHIKIDEVMEVAGEYSIFTVPTILFFIEKKEIIRKGRFISIVELKENIKRYYELFIV
ncbi:thioredoxin family protein [Clostridium aestuarii]|uniref:Thioredoxin family protein n=1 Tax=Clostridium aestuarii TaxID=338193 RepID=A0ABT4D3J7_9CLOT|nr:thioredoxin family protein [Clostridium aestuarii]MCY6485822.1 thioredoxin family protein [Clostridium aestuarii]